MLHITRLAVTGDTIAVGVGRPQKTIPKPTVGTSRVCVDRVKTEEEREGWGLQGTEYYAVIELEGAQSHARREETQYCDPGALATLWCCALAMP